MDQNNYDFILNQNQAPKKSFGFNGSDKKQRIIMVVIGAVLLIIGAIILYSVITGSQKSTAELLAPVAAAQTDIIEITDTGKKEARDIKLINTSASTNAVVISQNTATNAQLGKDAKKLIAPYQNTEYKKELETAKNSGSFDKTYQAILSNRLDLYRQTLVTAYNQAKSNKLKKELEAYYSQVGVLIGEPTTPKQ